MLDFDLCSEFPCLLVLWAKGRVLTGRPQHSAWRDRGLARHCLLPRCFLWPDDYMHALARAVMAS